MAPLHFVFNLVNKLNAEIVSSESNNISTCRDEKLSNLEYADDVVQVSFDHPVFDCVLHLQNVQCFRIGLGANRTSCLPEELLEVDESYQLRSHGSPGGCITNEVSSRLQKTSLAF